MAPPLKKIKNTFNSTLAIASQALPARVEVEGGGHREEVAPSVTACCFSLRSRRHGGWPLISPRKFTFYPYFSPPLTAERPLFSFKSPAWLALAAVPPYPRPSPRPGRRRRPVGFSFSASRPARRAGAESSQVLTLRKRAVSAGPRPGLCNSGARKVE